MASTDDPGERASNPTIRVAGLDFEWDQTQGLLLCQRTPAVCMSVEGTMAGFLSGLHRMVGTERFNLALYSAGEDGVQGDWETVIAKAPSLEEGLRRSSEQARATGLGDWHLVSLDREGRQAVFRSRNSWEGLYQRALGVAWGSSSLAGRFAGYGRKLFGTNVWAEQTRSIALGDECDEFVVRPSERTVDKELDALIAEDKASRADLDAALERLRLEVSERRAAEERLKDEVRERKQTERTLLEKLEIIRRQEESIRAMSTPILQLWEGILALPVIGFVDSSRASQMMESLLEAIVRTKARHTILDLTGVELMDTSAANHLLKVVRAAALLGTQCLVSGISPRMAQTIVGLDLDLGELISFSTLESALRYALEQETQPAQPLPGRPSGAPLASAAGAPLEPPRPPAPRPLGPAQPVAPRSAPSPAPRPLGPAQPVAPRSAPSPAPRPPGPAQLVAPRGAPSPSTRRAAVV
ncbi:MAG: STAS domain-containing protein [Polyangiaceae bacterium]|nr:STAS domain-containing protein [Polyangiaceae bacterium]